MQSMTIETTSDKRRQTVITFFDGFPVDKSYGFVKKRLSTPETTHLPAKRLPSISAQPDRF